MAQKKDLVESSLAEIKKSYTKKQELNKCEILDIQHTAKILLWRIICDMLFWSLLIGFGLVCYYYRWDIRKALEVAATWIIEYFIIRQLDKNKTT